MWRIPCSSAVLSEARLYAIESSGWTLDYQGWEDQHHKMHRLTYGKFAQLWVYEFCRINGIDCQKDTSDPKQPDDRDLIICGHDVDVKTSINPKLLGQISPGMYRKTSGFFCFVLTDTGCTFIMPRGFLHCSHFESHSDEVKKGDIIPGTGLQQRFGSSRFLRRGAPVVGFYDFMADAKNGGLQKHIPLSMAEALE